MGYRQQLVWVLNRNTGPGFEPFVDMFDGEEWEFPSRRPVEVPATVAQHCFGFGCTEDSEGYLWAMRRHNWNLMGQKGREIMGNFVCSTERPSDPSKPKAA